MASPFLDLLDTNYCPSDGDIPRIQAIINANTCAASSIDEDITHLLSSLIKRRDTHLDSANRHASLLSPIRRIPDDILSTVFHAHLRTKAQAPLTRAHPAVVVSHVCQRWRRLAMCTPSLWNGIHLYLPQVSIEQFLQHSHPTTMPNEAVRDEAVVRWKAMVDRMLAIAQLWLDRSGECPIEVTLGAIFPVRPSTGINFSLTTRRCLQFLCNVAHRWRSAQFDLSFGGSRIGGFSNVLEPLTLLQPHNVPRLESLSLKTSELRDGPNQHPTIPMSLILQGAALRTLHLPTACHEWTTLPINWSTLKELRFSPYRDIFTNHSPPAIEFFDSQAFFLLRECHGLVSCDLTIYGGSWELDGLDQASPRCITGIASLPDLQSLTIRASTPSAKFFQALNLPSLHTLHLTSPTPTWGQNLTTNLNRLDFTRPSIPSNPALDWIESVGHQLRTVSLSITDVNTNALQSLLEDLPSVSDLKLSDVETSVNGVQSMADVGLARLLTLHSPSPEIDLHTSTHGGPTVSVCPQLRRLHLDISKRPGAITEAGVLGVIASRRRAPLDGQKRGDIARLEDVTVEFPTFPTMNIREELERRGVDVNYFRCKASYPTPLPFILTTHPVSVADAFS